MKKWKEEKEERGEKCEEKREGRKKEKEETKQKEGSGLMSNEDGRRKDEGKGRGGERKPKRNNWRGAEKRR